MFRVLDRKKNVLCEAPDHSAALDAFKRLNHMCGDKPVADSIVNAEGVLFASMRGDGAGAGMGVMMTTVALTLPVEIVDAVRALANGSAKGSRDVVRDAIVADLSPASEVAKGARTEVFKLRVTAAVRDALDKRAKARALPVEQVAADAVVGWVQAIRNRKVA